MTDADHRLSCHLRARRMWGCKFHGQYPIGPYIADFASSERRLVIDADGGQYNERTGQDAERTSYLGSHGYTILRCWDNEVLRKTETVLDKIHGELQRGTRNG